MRELRALFRRNERGPPQRDEPQNIWEGNYFRELDEYIEEDNIRLQEVARNTHQRHAVNRNNHGVATLRDEMLRELNRLRDIMMGHGEQNAPVRPPKIRNKDVLYTILDEMEVHVSLVKQTIFIHKKYGIFEISLNDADVFFIPSTCLRCESHCGSRERHICIVRHDSSNDGYCVVRTDESEEGWEQTGLTPIDLLILSKAVALENNMIPLHVINQMNNKFNCSFTGVTDQHTIHGLRNLMLQEFGYPQELRDLPLPPRPRTGRALIIEELQNLFRRRRIMQENPAAQNT